jgi:hypothetical protein
MTDHTQDLEAKLGSLARATDGLRARPGLSSRVLLAVERASVHPSWLESVTMSARTGFLIAAFATAAAIVVAWQSEARADEAQAVAYSAVGVEW